MHEHERHAQVGFNLQLNMNTFNCLLSECQAPKLPYQIYYYIIFAVLGFLAPLLIIVISYILILWSIIKSQVLTFF